MVTDPLDDGALVDAAAAARAEWRADEGEWTAAAYEQWCHGRRLVDRARDHLHRGDTIAIELSAGRVVTGTVAGVADDLLALRTAAGRLDVRLDADGRVAWRVVTHAPDGGGRGIALDSFRARLLELEADRRRVELGTRVGDGVMRGRIEVGFDHAAVVDDAGVTSAVVGMGALEWVRALDE
jgi:hypothetical protein